MELDWSTVTLEIVNFLVLVWLLKHFFYRPVLAVIEKRRADTAAIIADADTRRAEAEALKADYASKLAGLDQARVQALARLDEEIAATRTARLQTLAEELAGERQRQQGLAERDTATLRTNLEREAMQLGARFVARLLDQLASPELETRLLALALAELEDSSAERLRALQAALQAPATTVSILTAYPMAATQRAAFSNALGKLAGHEVSVSFAEDASLRAGLSLSAGAWVLMANLRDELAFFAEVARDAR